MTVRNIQELPSALGPEYVGQWIRGTSQGLVAIFLDYDGTITPIVDRPEEAFLAAATRDRLDVLSKRCPVTIVTGRDVEVARKFIQLDQLTYAGCHGLDIQGPVGSGMRHQVAGEHLPVIDSVEAYLRQELQHVNGLIVERKTYGVSVHYRLVKPIEVQLVNTVVENAMWRFKGLRRENGKKVFELVPDVLWDKGVAVRWILRNIVDTPCTPIYIGDDQTDENAFGVLEDRGVPIVVADDERMTAAHYRLRNTDEVMRLIDLIIDALPPQ